ncbi:MAG: DJ-1/PfpI family protein [Oligoflexia bacterium]|nr:DJ-1/PfpI family protein [Oligoflexia bacterium]
MKIKRIITFATAFFIPPIILGVLLTFSTLSTLMLHKTPAPLELAPEELEAALARILPPRAPGKPRAAILVANDGTQLSELFIAYELLAESGALEVFTVAPERVLSPTTGPIAIFPHYSFKDAPAAEILVLPSVLDPGNAALSQWVRTQAPRAKAILLLGEGARLAAQAGLLKGVSVTTHFVAAQDLTQTHPDIRWQPHERVLEDGRFISSEGLAASIDATLALLTKIAGTRVAQTTVGRLGLTENPEAPEPGALRPRDFAQLLLRGGFDWSKKYIAALVTPGVSEIALAAALDTFPRSHDAYALTVAPVREPIASRHGLALVPSDSTLSAPYANLLIVPASGSTTAPEAPLDNPELKRWIADNNVLVKTFSREAPGQAYARMLAIVSDLYGRGTAAFVAKMIRLPLPAPASSASSSPEHGPGDWPWELWVKPILVGLLGVTLAAWLEARIRRVKTARPQEFIQNREKLE